MRWLATLMACLFTAPPAGSGQTVQHRELPAEREADQALLAWLGPRAAVRRTPHFVIAFDTDAEMAETLTARLEQTCRRVLSFCEAAGIPCHAPPERMEVLFFEQRAGYDRYAARLDFNSAGTYGAYFESTNQAAFFNVANDPEVTRLRADITAAHRTLDQLMRTLATIRGNRSQVKIDFADGRHLAGSAEDVRAQVEREIKVARQQIEKLDARHHAYIDRMNRVVVQHEAAHQVLFNTGVHTRGAANPRWLVEGLATLFEAPADPAGPAVVPVNDLRLRDFRAALRAATRPAASTPADDETAADRLVSLDRLVTEPALFDERSAQAARHYAVVWALTYFLYRTQAPQLAACIRDARNRGRSADSPEVRRALFRRHFGPPDQAMADRMAAYVLALPASSPH